MLLTYLTLHSEIRKMVTVEVMDNELNKRRSLTFEESVYVFKHGFLDSFYILMCKHIKELGARKDDWIYVLANEVVIESFVQGVVKDEIKLSEDDEWSKGVIHKVIRKDLHIDKIVILLNEDKLHMLDKDYPSNTELAKQIINSVILFTGINDVCLELKLDQCKEFSFYVNYFFIYKEAKKELRKRCLLELEDKHKRILKKESRVLAKAFEKTNI